VEEYAKAQGLAIMQLKIDFPARMNSWHHPNGKIYMIPAGKYILMKPRELGNGDMEMIPYQVPSCRNQLLQAPRLKWVPRTKVRVDKEIWMGAERFRDIQTFENQTSERVQTTIKQVDMGALIAAGLLGLGLGYLFWFGKTATNTVVQTVSAVCAPGLPPAR